MYHEPPRWGIGGLPLRARFLLIARIKARPVAEPTLVRR